MKGFLVVLAFAALVLPGRSLDIQDFGAIPSDTSFGAAQANGKALYSAVVAANSSDVDRVVVIPKGSTFTFVPYAVFEYVHDVTIQLDGVISFFSTNQSLWPGRAEKNPLNGFEFTDGRNLTLTGTGTVEGNGNPWWWEVIIHHDDQRPDMLRMKSCQYVLIEGWTMRNSPQFHMYLDDMLDLVVQKVTVYVDTQGQSAMLQKHSLMSTSRHPYMPEGIPTFPLNTDGIDVAGQRIIVRECTVTNYDDSVCIKPMRGNGKLSGCSSDILIENININFGVGATVGSVPPNPAVNCVRNVTFRNIYQNKPIKAIYVKPNPGTKGTGVIDQVTYENMYAKSPVWWSIWVSTQQQKQPGSSGTGCSFLYPAFNTSCPTQPLVPVTNLVLRNVTMVDALLSPGILRCDPGGPCTGWVFEDVKITSLSNWPSGKNYMCQSVIDPKFINSEPKCG